jgi:hypothetical protein
MSLLTHDVPVSSKRLSAGRVLGALPAVATNVRVGDPPFIGPVLAGRFVWAGLYLRNGRFRALIPLLLETIARGSA